MKKQLRKLLSALLVLTMLLSALPMGVFAEEDHVSAVVDELTEEGTKELDAEPTIELNEEPAAEPTEEPAVQPTVAPIVDSSDDALENATAGEPKTEPEKEPAVQPTVAPIVDSIDDALENATAGEPETEPEKEPETTPAAEDEVDEGKPEETPTPAENNDDDTLSGLTDEQRKTLNALPEGFSADVVASAMLRSTGCAHTLLKVSEVFDESYTSIDSKKHLFMKKNLSRKLFCSACGEALQTIELGDVEEEWSHSWYSDGNTGGSLFDFTCLDCDEKITINPPCSHGSYSLNKNRTPYCTECGAIAYPGESMTMDDLCKHTHYTVHYPNTKLTEYSRWNDASHLKTTKVAQYTDDSESSQYYPAVCNDCGAELVYLPSGKVEQSEGYDGESWINMEYVQTASDFEVHTFANGVCKYCGEEQSEETCQHTNVKQVENTAKKTIDVTPVDDAEHQITTTRYFELRCADCDAYIGEAPADVSTQNEAHVWDNKNICTKCDYGNDCTHNNSTFHHYAKGDTHTGYQWTGNGETHYVIKYEVLVECDCCLGCMRFYLSSGTDGESRKLVSAESVTREKERYTETCHITNGWTGKRYFCMYCGYEKVMCDHSSGNTVDRLDRTVEPLYSDITETTHREQYTYNRYCDDCDTYLETVLGEVLAPVAHNFGNGNTCDCGYTKTEEPCQHTETKRVENTGKRTMELKPFSETEHEVTTTKYYELHCAACDAYISDDGTDTTTEKQSHDFSSGNTCACGYTEEPCQHTETKRVENTGKRMTELKSLNETEHEATTTKYYELHCAACDAYISDDGTDTTTEKQPHDFGSGTTCACGYVKAVEPSGKSVIKNVSISADARACVEKVGGETFAVTVTCNLDTVWVEMYFGKEHNQNTYRDSSDYVEANGNRIFKMTYTLGGDGKSYAGEYPISVRPFSYVDRADWKNNQMGEEVKITLKVTHDNEVVDRIVKDAYEHTANGHTKIQNITTVLKCKVCGATDKQVANKSVGAEEAHTLDANGRCNVCGYGRRIKDAMYKLEKMKFRDKFKESEYYKKLCEVELTGDIRKDVIEIARSQMKVEGGKNKDTEYGYWIGKNNDEWCASFASWCIYVAAYANDIDPNEVIRKATGASFRWDCFNLSGKKGAYDPPQAFTFRQVKDGYKYKEDETIKVEMGDLVFITWGKDGIKERNKFDDDNKLPYHDGKMSVPISHVGIVEKFYSNGDGTYTLMTLEGNTGKKNGGLAKMRSLIIKADGTMIEGGARIGTILYFGKPNYEAGK